MVNLAFSFNLYVLNLALDEDEISLLEDLYEMNKDDGLPSTFYKLPDAIKKETIMSLAKRGKVQLYEGDEGYKFVR